MFTCLDRFSLVKATLLLSLMPGLQLTRTSWEIKAASAQGNAPLISTFAQTVDARAAEAEQFFLQGIKQGQNAQFSDAAQSLQKALTIYREIGNRSGEASALVNLGNAYAGLGNYSQAIEYIQQSLAIFRASNDSKTEEQVLHNLGAVTFKLLQRGIEQYEENQIDEALQSCQKALRISQQFKNRKLELAALGTLGNIYRNQKDYEKAIDFYRQSLSIAQELQDPELERMSMESLQKVYLTKTVIDFERGNYAQVIEYSQQSLAIAQQLHNSHDQAETLNNLGLVYEKLGSYAKAIDYYNQSLSISKKNQDHQGEAYSLGNLGSVYLELGDYRQAIKFHEQSLAIKEEIKDRLGQAHTLGNLGLIYAELGNYNKAIEYHGQALTIAKEISERQTEGKALGHLGIVYFLLGDYTKAINYYQQSLAVKRAVADREGEASTLGNLGQAFRLSGNLVEAEKNLRYGIQVWESIRTGLGENDANKVSFFDTYVFDYMFLQKVLLEQNRPNDALEIAERGRARAFVELLARQLFSLASTDTTAFPSPNIQQIQEIAQEQHATLVQYSVIYEAYKGKVQAQESELYIWVINPTGQISFRSVNLSSLDTPLKNLVTNTRQSIGVRGRDNLDISFEPASAQSDRLKQLHKLLIEPIAQYLPTDPNDRVIFIPQNELFLVPFPALQDASDKYLIQKHTILTAPSIQVLQLTHQKRSTVSGNGVLVVGNPTMPSVTTTVGESPLQLKNLPGAQKEATDIAQLLNTQALTGNQATKAAVLPKLSNARIIHLATHGLLDDFKGLGVPGAIALAPDATGELNDGLLTSNEIFDLKLNAELVVLSACDTGRGKLTGDGVIGLSRSLITAGVPSIIVSLWSVPDAPTASLMTQFYQNLKQNPDKAQALRQAMLTTMEKHPNPRDWAAFTLIGEAQ